MNNSTTIPSGPHLARTGSTAADTARATNRLTGHRRRNVPYLLLGLVLVFGCTAGFMLVTITSGDRLPVLALARPVVVGQGLSPGDLQEVAIAVDVGLPTVPASEAPAVIGKRIATSLPAGSLLSPEVLGRTSIPSADRAVAALGLSAGQIPAEVFPGARVLVVFVPSATSGGQEQRPLGGPATWTATVISVAGRSEDSAGSASEGSLVVSVELDKADAREVATVPAGQLALVLLSGGDR